MSHDILRPVAPPQPAAAPAPASPTTTVDGLSFQRVLESLRRMNAAQPPADAANGEGEAETDVATLQDALRAADDGFVSAMDLRQKLEAAFRAHRP